jgi:ribosomal protein L32E
MCPTKTGVELCLGPRERVKVLLFNPNGVHTVSVKKLDDLTVTGSQRSVGIAMTVSMAFDQRRWM